MSLVGFKARNHPQQVGKNGAAQKVDDRETPASIFDPLHERFHFTIDVAASYENRKLSRYFCLEQDGLAETWVWDRVWCNPPYSDIWPWVEKAWFEYQKGCKLIVMLLPANRTEQRWWQELVEPHRDRPGGVLSTEFLPGRPRFDVPGGYNDPRGNRPPFGCCLLIWDGLA